MATVFSLTIRKALSRESSLEAQFSQRLCACSEEERATLNGGWPSTDTIRNTLCESLQKRGGAPSRCHWRKRRSVVSLTAVLAEKSRSSVNGVARKAGEEEPPPAAEFCSSPAGLRSGTPFSRPPNAPLPRDAGRSFRVFPAPLPCTS
ncbi:hypothetical protein MTO96_033748 [Rhipicephalus appendiculatus]